MSSVLRVFLKMSCLVGVARTVGTGVGDSYLRPHGRRFDLVAGGDPYVFVFHFCDGANNELRESAGANEDGVV